MVAKDSAKQRLNMTQLMKELIGETTSGGEKEQMQRGKVKILKMTIMNVENNKTAARLFFYWKS